MSTAATAIRAAIFALLEPLKVSHGFTKVRSVPVAMLQPDDLPAISISLLNERLTPNGDDNTGPLTFDSEVTIGISVVRGFAAPNVLDTQADADVDLIEQILLCDPDFTKFADPLFEAVTGITRRRLYPQAGESYLVEVRIEMSFRTSVDFETRLPSSIFASLGVTVQPAGSTSAPSPEGTISVPTN